VVDQEVCVRVVRGAACAAALASLLPLAGCEAGGRAQPTPSASPPPASATPDTPAPVTLRLALYGDRTLVAAYRRIARTFTASRPEVTVEVVTHPDAESAATAARTGLEAGGGPDLFLLDSTHLPGLLRTERLQPLDAMLEERGLQFGDDFQRAALTAFSADSGLQCMPTEMSPLVVYYNRDLVPRRALTAAGFVLPRGGDPWTWVDFEAAARATAGLDRLGPIKGTYVPPELELVVAFLRSAAAPVVDDELAPTTLTLSADESREVLTEVSSLARDSPVSLTEEDLTRRDPVAWFAAGRLGLLFGTREDLPRLRAAAGLRFDALTLPSFGRSRSAATMRGLCVDAGSPQVEVAADFVAHAVGDGAARILARTDQLVPARVDTLESRAFTDPGQAPRHPQAYIAANRRSQPFPFSPRWPEVAEVAEEVLDQLYTEPSLDLGFALVPRLARLDERSRQLFAEAEPPAG